MPIFNLPTFDRFVCADYGAASYTPPSTNADPKVENTFNVLLLSERTGELLAGLAACADAIEQVDQKIRALEERLRTNGD